MTTLEHQDFESIIVRDDAPIRDALEKISNNRLLAVCVIDKTNFLLGTVTDGDIRYGMLKGINLDITVRSIMNPNPVVVSENRTTKEIYDLMVEKGFMIIPVVDSNNHLIDYHHFFELSVELMSRNKTFVPSPIMDGAISTEKEAETIVVIGGAGYIGSMVTRKLISHGYSVRVLDALLYGDDGIIDLMDHPKFEFVRGDVRDSQILLSTLRNADAVVHLGEIVGDPACALNDSFTLDVNFLATRNIVEICVLYGIRRMVFASSCSVYGVGQKPLGESSELNPISLYAQCKIQSEKVILSYASESFSPTILRLATVFGPSYRPRFDLFVNLFTAQSIFDGKLTIYGGQQWRPLISVDDAARALTMCIESSIELVGAEIFNAGDKDLNYKVIDVGREIVSLMPKAKLIQNSSSQDERNYNVDFSKINTRLNYRCKTTLRAGLTDVAKMINDRNIRDYNYKFYHNLLTLRG